MAIVHKLNESYSAIEADSRTLTKINDFLKVQIPGAYFDPLVKRGFKSPYHYFASEQNGMLLVLNGHLDVLGSFGINKEILQSEYNELEIEMFYESIKSTLPFEPYDYQLKAFKESILKVKQINKMCTSSGKSYTISLIAEFFRQKKKKGLLLVPNINLLTQFKNDIKDYNLLELYNDTHTIGGGSTSKNFDCSLTISTWQSLQNWKDELDKIDYIICDEAHRFKSDVTSSIVSESTNCRYKFGFTGTLPEDPIGKMQLLGLFGMPKTYITSKELIERGLATPIFINTLILNYSTEDKHLFRTIEKNQYNKQLMFIKEHEKRNELIVNLTNKILKIGNTLVLGQHIEHLKDMYLSIMKKLYPEVEEIQNKDITGKKSFEFQEQYGVYYISGSDDAKTRELTRKILEEDLFKITFDDDSIIRLHGNKEIELGDKKEFISNLKIGDIIDNKIISSIEIQNQVLVSGYQLLSTGVNIKKLYNVILASPLKSYTTITQSLGRGMRLYKDKDKFMVFDIVDNFGLKKPSGIFYKQYQQRCANSYYPEEFPVTETFVELDLLKNN